MDPDAEAAPEPARAPSESAKRTAARRAESLAIAATLAHGDPDFALAALLGAALELPALPGAAASPSAQAVAEALEAVRAELSTGSDAYPDADAEAARASVSGLAAELTRLRPDAVRALGRALHARARRAP